MPAARMTGAHFSVYATMNLPKSAGEPANVSPPRSLKRDLNLGSASPALIAPLSLSMTSAVPFGAPIPYQPMPS
jgi:hypothetical protein